MKHSKHITSIDTFHKGNKHPILILSTGLITLGVMIIYYWRNPDSLTLYSFLQAILPLALVFTGAHNLTAYKK